MCQYNKDGLNNNNGFSRVVGDESQIAEDQKISRNKETEIIVHVLLLRSSNMRKNGEKLGGA